MQLHLSGRAWACRYAMSDKEDAFEPAADTHVAAGISPELIQRELARITRSSTFEPSRRHQQFLRHLVEQAVAGNAGALKEHVLAIEVFERPHGQSNCARTLGASSAGGCGVPIGPFTNWNAEPRKRSVVRFRARAWCGGPRMGQFRGLMRSVGQERRFRSN